ncbi:HEAT repeat domain-containing protein [Streptomyces sp. A012304]|uniref:HEAT repeat domain-containing protein n=1 Tax=Streptomyces sp. A012304 TaxID=375446 RepID=UPI00222ED476|nr:HEAT repeat domain-containing protein [Streptomyces sp. A012304]GKQ36195.1 hypothetical protein ALMP_27380 [Streptomyces sp. A012304]
MVSEHQIAHFLRELAGAGDAHRRAAAAKGLGRLGGVEHTAVLVRAARDPEPEVRAAAAVGLGRLGARQAGAEVLPALLDDPDARVRRRASLAAIRLDLDGPDVRKAFARLLRDPDHHVRINAVTGLDALGTFGDAAALTELHGDPDVAVWGRARGLLYRFADDPAVEAEMVRTAREGVGAARARALDILPSRFTEPLLDSLFTGLRDPSEQVRAAVAGRLLGVDSAAARDALVEALERETDPRAATVLLHGLGGHGERRATDPAVRWLADPEAGRWAADALGGIGTSAAASHLRSALHDRTLPGATRAAVAEALGQARTWDAVWLLLPLLDDADRSLRVGALKGLGTLVRRGLWLWERHAVTQALVAHLESERDDPWHARNALDGLARALPAVRRLADESPSGEVRAAALSLLDVTDADDDMAVEDVRRCVRGLDDPYEAVRYRAVIGLARWVELTGAPPPDSDGVHERLAVLASHPSARLRRAAADLLDTLGPAAPA